MRISNVVSFLLSSPLLAGPIALSEILSLSAVCFRLESEGSRKQTLQKTWRHLMKTNRFNSVLSSAILLSAIAMGLLVSTGSVQAQSSLKATATIPFAFQAGSRHMPAGQYDIYELSPHVVLFRAANGHASGYLMVTPSQGKLQEQGRLVFHRYGNRYFLREVWDARSNQGVECSPSAEEKEILRAQNQQPATQTQIALNTEKNR
jgi:hypothetical protein